MGATVIEDITRGENVVIYHPELVNLYRCTIGDGTMVGPFVEVQAGAVIGAQSKVCSHAFICANVTIGDRVFVGHGVMFCNDRFPVIGGPVFLENTVIADDVSIGSGAVILPGVTIWQGAIIGAGAVVTEDVQAWCIVAGTPARVVRQFGNASNRESYLKYQHENSINHHATA